MKGTVLNFISLITGTALVAVSLLYPLGSVFAGTPSFALSPASAKVVKGCTFSVQILIDSGGSQVDGADAILIYDPTRLKAEKIVNGNIFAEYLGNNIDAQTGKVTVSGLASISSPFTSSGTMATVDFTVLSEAPVGATQIKFDFNPQEMGKSSDSNIADRSTATDILGSVTDGTYTIGAGSCGTTPSTPSNPSASSSGSKTPVFQGGIEPTTIQTKPLPEAGVAELTWILVALGGCLTLFGALGIGRLNTKRA